MHSDTRDDGSIDDRQECQSGDVEGHDTVKLAFEERVSLCVSTPRVYVSAFLQYGLDDLSLHGSLSMKKTTVLVAIAAAVVVEDGGVDTVCVAFIVATICLPTYLPNLPA